MATSLRRSFAPPRVCTTQRGHAIACEGKLAQVRAKLLRAQTFTTTDSSSMQEGQHDYEISVTHDHKGKPACVHASWEQEEPCMHACMHACILQLMCQKFHDEASVRFLQFQPCTSSTTVTSPAVLLQLPQDSL